MDLRGLRMARDIGQRFLQRAVQHGFMHVQAGLVRIGQHEGVFDGNAGGARKFRQQLKQGRLWPLLQRGRAQAGDHAAQGRDALVDIGCHALHGVGQAGGGAVGIGLQAGDIHFERQQILTQVIVQIARQAAPLLGLDVLPLGGHLAKLAPGQMQRVFRSLQRYLVVLHLRVQLTQAPQQQQGDHTQQHGTGAEQVD